VLRVYSGRKVMQRTTHRKSITIIESEERCFSSIDEVEEEFGSSMLMSADKGRAEM
jgi:hypothetical protein